MIRTPTVFILGAGAHCSYGFPSGELLKKHALSFLRPKDFIRRNLALLTEHGIIKNASEVNDSCIDAFVHALTYAGQPSIDAFLHANRHQTGFSTIGKIAIAQILLEQEGKTGYETHTDDDWIDHVFKLMIEDAHDPETFSRNQIGFVTFNYDRTLERWLFTKIKYSFGLSDEESLRVLKFFPIHHVYGDLGEFAPGDNPFRAWLAACKRIRTIFEVDSAYPPLESAVALLSKARRVCFLGFGFHGENIKVLKMPNSVAGAEMLVASRYEITDMEWRRLRAPFGGQTFSQNYELQKCLETLRHSPLFV